LEDREACIQACPCQCNDYCLRTCHKAGLDAVCDQSCGCVRQKSAEVAGESSPAEEQKAQEVEESKENPQAEQPLETKHEDDAEQQVKEAAKGEESNHDDKDHDDEKDDEKHHHKDKHHKEKHHDKKHHEKESDEKHDDKDATEAIAVPSVTMAAAKDNKEDIEFRNLVSEMIDETKNCEPPCWRKCLQMRAGKEQVFKCIKDCNCGYESPHLLLLQKDTVEAASTGTSGGFVIMLLLLVLAAIAGLGYYIYKREFDLKLHEDLIYEEDNEGGYEKLD
jgi:flagellar motor protein MotB